MEMIIFIGCFWEVELGYTPNVYTSKLDSKPDFSFLFAYSCCFFFSFFAKHFSRCCLPDTRCVFFSSLVLKKEPFSVRFFEERKRNKQKDGDSCTYTTYIYIFLFLFFPFLINVSIFYVVILKEKFFFNLFLSLLKKLGRLEYKKH